MKTTQRIIMASALVLALTTNVFAQINTNLQFTAVAVTDEHAIRLAWASTNSEVYEIDEADGLATNADGTTTWNDLYDDYPSQGTNTFWLDTGNYNLVPQILHPKDMPMRFYRIVDKGADTLSDEPNVSITSPTNGVAVTGELMITVVASTDQLLSETKLYVDGEEMPDADNPTNYFASSTNYFVDTYSINTCEWGNGSHTLFATARSASAPEGPPNVPAPLTGHAVSTFVPVIFSNLVERISFSQPSFDPSSGQTQQVSAVFAANSDWTLNIVDIYSNVVQTASGSGTSMIYNWDGTSNGTNIPNGVYYYYISAETNGMAPQSLIGGGSSSGLSSASLSHSQRKELYAVAPDSENVVPFALYPQGFDTNGLIIFKATQAEVDSLYPDDAESGVAIAADSGGGGIATPNASPSAQPSPPAPIRPPTNPVKGVSGTFGIAYQTYAANGSSGYAPNRPDNGLNIGIHIQMEGYTTNISFCSLPEFKSEANNFVKAMKKGSWSSSFVKANDQLNINDLRGSGTPFNQVNLGVLMTHGTYGTTIDYAANGCKQMYFPIASGGSAQYLRMSEMNLGGAGTNGLEWMALMSCFSLYHTDWNNMQNLGVKPYNSNLHLLLGCDTLVYTDSHLMEYWAKNMLSGTNTIKASWYAAGQKAYAGQGYSAPISFAVAGDDACQDDMLQTNSAPTGTPYYNRL